MSCFYLQPDREGGKEGFGGQPEGEGLTGLKALGVRDLSYKLCFLACAVSPMDSRVCALTREK